MKNEDADVGVGEVWNEAPRPRQCVQCLELERQLAAANVELRWMITARNAALAEVHRLMVQAELVKYGDAPFRLRK